VRRAPTRWFDGRLAQALWTHQCPVACHVVTVKGQPGCEGGCTSLNPEPSVCDPTHTLTVTGQRVGVDGARGWTQGADDWTQARPRA
jgi:hypothetical protein